MIDNNKKLILEVFENQELDLPAMTLSGDDTFELFKPYLELIKIDCTSNTPNTIYRAKYKLLNFPFEKFLRDKQFHNTSVLAEHLISLNKAQWIKFNKNAFDPEKAKIKRKKSVLEENKKKQTVFFTQKLSGEEKKQFYKNNVIKRKRTLQGEPTHLLDDVLPDYLK